MFSSTKRDELFIKRKVIKQNITLFKVKLEWIKFSYTSVVKWYEKTKLKLDRLSNFLRKYIFIIIVFYSMIFLIFLNVNYYLNFQWSYLEYIDFNYNWLLNFIILLFVYLSLYFRIGLLSLILNIVFLTFIIIFWIVNF